MKKKTTTKVVSYKESFRPEFKSTGRGTYRQEDFNRILVDAYDRACKLASKGLAKGYDRDEVFNKVNEYIFWYSFNTNCLTCDQYDKVEEWEEKLKNYIMSVKLEDVNSKEIIHKGEKEMTKEERIERKANLAVNAMVDKKYEVLNKIKEYLGKCPMTKALKEEWYGTTEKEIWHNFFYCIPDESDLNEAEGYISYILDECGVTYETLVFDEDVFSEQLMDLAPDVEDEEILYRFHYYVMCREEEVKDATYKTIAYMLAYDMAHK